MDASKPGWFGRNWKWFVPVVALVPLLFVAFFFAVFALVVTIFKSTDVYEEAFERAKRDPQVVEALGTPIEDGIFPTGNINEGSGGGNADLQISIYGPRGEGTIYVEASKSGSTWRYSRLEADVGGERVDLR